jgi:mRNA-degrading endonuclease RelE of RelBE toxin-antitoxin system
LSRLSVQFVRPVVGSGKRQRSGNLAFEIEFSPDAEDHLRALTARQRSTVLDEVDVQLVHEPDVETRNRKPMRPNPVAPWELRIGEIRVYYDFVYEPSRRVLVRAVGIKSGNSVRIGGEEVQL